MKYKMEVTVLDSKSKQTETYIGEWEFWQREGDYGNKWWAAMDLRQNSKFINRWSFDLRYDRTFRPEKAKALIMNWADEFWAGEPNENFANKYGSWTVKTIEVEEVPSLEQDLGPEL